MTVGAKVPRVGRAEDRGRYVEALLFGLAAAALIVAGRLLFEVSLSIMSSASLGGLWIEAPGLAVLGFLAGQRRSRLDLLAVIVFFFGAWIVMALP